MPTVVTLTASYLNASETFSLIINPSITVTVSPSTVALTAGQTQQFTVQVTGTTNQEVTWAISPPGTGSMNGNTYLAPVSVASQQIVTLTATSVVDNTKSGTAQVTVNPPPPPPTNGAIAVYATGVVTGNTLAADGAVDSHYTITASADAAYPGPDARVVTSSGYPIGAWLLDGPNSKWIAPRTDAGNNNAGGSYTYHTTFDLTGVNPATAVLTGQFAADNSAIIMLNGVVVRPTAPTYNSWTPFSINSGFVAGVNSLDFVVTNDGSYPNPTGLRVDISGIAHGNGK